jgi:hypothetical protein
MGNFTWFIDCTSKSAKVNIHAIISELRENYYFSRFEDILPEKLSYPEKIDLLNNIDKLKTFVPEFTTFETFCSTVLNDIKLYGYLGSGDKQCSDNNKFIDTLIKHTELPPEGAAVMMYYEGFGPVAFIFPQNGQWYTMMGYSNWDFSYYFFNLVKNIQKCHKSEKESLQKELPAIKDFMEMFQNLESNPEYFLRRGFKKDSNETYIETWRMMGFSDPMIAAIHSSPKLQLSKHP